MEVNILISHIGLPDNSIGSWNIMFSKLLINKPNLFTHIIAPESESQLNSIEYFIVKSTLIKSHKLQKVLKIKKYKNYFTPLKSILNSLDFATISVVDNTNLLLDLDEFLSKNKLRNKVKIVYHLHGYDIKVTDKNHFFNALDTLFVLSNRSYQNIIDSQHALPCKVKQIYNGVDLNLFKKVDFIQQNKIKEELGLKSDITYYLWLSQDRKKKGLHLVLEAWKDFVQQNKKVHLLVIGTKDYGPFDKVTFLGRIKNEELPKFYQISTFFIFSTLCHEGHPLALTEALKSGCYCLASNIDPIEEILNQGEYGFLVDNPNNPLSWLESMNIAYEDYSKNGNKFVIPKKLYSLEIWMDTIEANILEEHNFKKIIFG